MRCVFLSLLCCIFYTRTVHNANILAIFPTPAHSHFSLGFRLMKELADRGHHITIVSPFPQKSPIKNYEDVPVESMSEALNELKKDFYKREQMDFITSTKFLYNMAYVLNKKFLSHENVQTLLKSNKSFDILVMEYFMSDATMGIGPLLGIPVVLSSSLPSSSINNHLFGNPAPISYVPYLLGKYTGKMTLWQRIKNIGFNLADSYYKEVVFAPLHDDLLKKYISKDLNIEDVKYSSSLILLNSHPSVTQPVPHVPNMIEIGGYHVGPLTGLPEDLHKFMDDATEGVILFSMGSNLKSSDLSEEKRMALLGGFRKIKEKVLWKFEIDISDLPKNVKVLNWLPQQEILAHPNTKVFISHGGLLSTIESVYFGVPLMGIPIFGDQKVNIATAVENGYAVSIDFESLNEENFSKALHKILSNPVYRETAKFRSKLMHDRPTPPLDSAVFWIEHVIKHEGAPHLRTAAMNLKWYQLCLLDVLFIISFLAISLILILRFISKIIMNKISSKNGQLKISVTKKNK